MTPEETETEIVNQYCDLAEKLTSTVDQLSSHTPLQVEDSSDRLPQAMIKLDSAVERLILNSSPPYQAMKRVTRGNIEQLTPTPEEIEFEAEQLQWITKQVAKDESDTSAKIKAFVQSHDITKLQHKNRMVEYIDSDGVTRSIMLPVLDIPEDTPDESSWNSPPMIQVESNPLRTPTEPYFARIESSWTPAPLYQAERRTFRSSDIHSTDSNISVYKYTLDDVVDREVNPEDVVTHTH